MRGFSPMATSPCRETELSISGPSGSRAKGQKGQPRATRSKESAGALAHPTLCQDGKKLPPWGKSEVEGHQAPGPQPGNAWRVALVPNSKGREAVD